MITSTARIPSLMPTLAVRRPTTMYRYFQRQTRSFHYVYTPTRAEQVRAGHVMGLWYFRPADLFSQSPVSCGYSSCMEAEDAVNISVETEGGAA